MTPAGSGTRTGCHCGTGSATSYRRETMPVPRDQKRPGRSEQHPEARLAREPGAWVPWPAVEALCRLDLKTGSHWRVLLAVLTTSCRYGGCEAKLGVDDLVRLT